MKNRKTLLHGPYQTGLEKEVFEKAESSSSRTPGSILFVARTSRRVNYLESEVVSTLEDCKTKYQEKRRRDRVDLARCLSKVVEKLLNLRRR